MHHIRTKTTYLEMHSPAKRPVEPPRTGIRIEQACAPSVEEYRAWYNGVGRDYNWVDRNLMPDDELRRIIQDEQVEIYVLRVEGAPAGYAELDRRTSGESELAYFGLYPRFVGQGLGKYFLGWAIERAWSHVPRRVWVHTCDLDHPAALPAYLKAGFTIYDERIIEQAVVDD